MPGLARLPRQKTVPNLTMPSLKKIALPLLAICTFSFFGCATPKQAELDANGKPIEYVWITPTGSNIPVKVRKDQVQTNSTGSSHDQEALRRIEQQSAKTPTQPGG